MSPARLRRGYAEASSAASASVATAAGVIPSRVSAVVTAAVPPRPVAPGGRRDISRAAKISRPLPSLCVDVSGAGAATAAAAAKRRLVAEVGAGVGAGASEGRRSARAMLGPGPAFLETDISAPSIGIGAGVGVGDQYKTPQRFAPPPSPAAVEVTKPSTKPPPPYARGVAFMNRDSLNSQSRRTMAKSISRRRGAIA